MLDLGELALKGRNQVKVEFTYKGARRTLVVAVIVKQGDNITYTKEQTLRVAADTDTVRSFPYEIKNRDRALWVSS